MNKKIITTIIIVVVIILAIVGLIFFIKNNTSVELNLEELNTSISEISPFNEMPTMDVDSEILSSSYEISQDEYEEAIGKMPMMNIQASMYLVIKAKDGAVDSVKQKVEKYAQTQENIWSTYLPEQYLILQLITTAH